MWNLSVHIVGLSILRNLRRFLYLAQINEWKVVHCCNCHKDFEIDDVEINADSMFEALTEG